MQVLFMRHGQTEYNLRGLCNDDPTQAVYLTPTGIAQAEAAAEILRATPLDLIVTSELPRTRQTGEIINRYHQLTLHTHPALNDIRSGHDGRPVGEYQRAIADDPLHARPAGGESLIEHKQRGLPETRTDDDLAIVAGKPVQACDYQIAVEWKQAVGRVVEHQ